MKTKRITIADIAEKSGYSKTAVSFAFNCPERISKEAAERILQIAQELDYFPDPMARNFSLGRHLSIGFLVPQAMSETLNNPHSVDVLKGIGSVAEDFGYTVTLIPPLRSSIPEAIKNATVDGIISFGLEFSEEVRDAMQRRKLPLVCIDGINTEDAVTVSIDNTEAAERQMSEVLERGHREVAVISLPEAAYIENKGEVAPGVSEFRARGYAKAYEKLGLEPTFSTHSGLATKEGGKEMAKAILTESKPTCIVCMSDIQAAGAIEGIREMGYKVPEDISVIGFDGIWHDGLGLRLDTIEQRGYDKGRKAAEILFEMMKGTTPAEQHTLVSFSFIPGDTLRSI